MRTPNACQNLLFHICFTFLQHFDAKIQNATIFSSKMQMVASDTYCKILQNIQNSTIFSSKMQMVVHGDYLGCNYAGSVFNLKNQSSVLEVT